MSHTCEAAALLLASGLSCVMHADVLTFISPNEAVAGYFGVRVDGIPDLTGDGVDDFIIGASGEAGAGVAGSGRAYVYSGATGVLIRTHESPNPTVSGDFGFHVTGINDLTGDGRGDYAIAAPDENGAAGRVYVYNGATGALIRTHNSPNSESNGDFGTSMTGVRDLSGDGRGDYLVGAPGENGDRGRVYVYNGSTGALIRTHNSPNAETSGFFGQSVGYVPDVNNDARGDYVIGAPHEDPGASPEDAGRAYLYSGINGALLRTYVSPNEEPLGFFGWVVGGVPDATGDARGDVIIGAPYEDVTVGPTTYTDSGRAYLYNGSTGTLLHTYRSTDATIDNGDNFGFAVDGVADSDDDGFGEIVVGAPGWPGYYVFQFRASGDYGVMQSINTPDDTGANQFFGSSVAAVGDANGDGRGDFAIGGYGSDNFPSGPSQGGRAYLHRTLIANNLCTAITIDTLHDGPNSFSNIGASGTASGSECLDNLGRDVWFTYTATCTGAVLLSTCNAATFDTVIAVYDGCSYGGAPLFPCQLGAFLTCADDAVGCAGFTTEAVFDAIDGECYFVRVGGYLSAQGVGTLTVTCGCPADLNGDGSVGPADLAILLGQWNTSGTADLNGDGIVNSVDLSQMLAAWGPC